MRKIMLIVSFLFTTHLIQAQGCVSLNVTGFKDKPNVSSSTGFGFSFSFKSVYVDMSSNFASGKGERLDFSSSYTYKSDKENIGVMNFGVKVATIGKKTRLDIIPILGYYWVRDIYQDPILFDSYYTSTRIKKLNAGLVTRLMFDKVGLLVGIGTSEVFKVGLNFDLK